MAEHENQQAMPMPEPDPALKRLEKFVGTWEFKGRTLDSDEDNVFGTTTFEWLPVGFFLLQRIERSLPVDTRAVVGFPWDSMSSAARLPLWWNDGVG
jgi:hypothetical protein